MKIEDIRKKERTKLISIRTPVSNLKWMKKNRYSASKIFNTIVKEMRQNESKPKE